MRRFIPLLFLGLAAIGLCGAGQPAPQRLIEFSDQDKAELDRVSAYLNSVRTMKGGFIQIAPNGQVDQGLFYMSKPGRVRFEYRYPNPTLIVSDGYTVAVKNSKLNTVDRYPLSETPLGLILADKIDLLHNQAIVGVEHQPGSLVILARSSNNRVRGNISFVFSEPELELRQWTVEDNQGLSTIFELRDTQPGVALASSLFVMPEKNPFAHRREE
jgi:outer membrane lipoprotein-sorting protein